MKVKRIIDKKKAAFTLVELLAVIAIIGLLSALVAVTTSGLREQANIDKNLTWAKKADVSFKDNLMGSWSMDKTSAIHNSIVFDSSGQGNYGTLVTNDGTTNKAVVGIINNALSFDGVDDYVNAGNDSSLNFTSEDFSIGLWIKTSDGGGTLIERGLSQVDGYTLMFDPYVHLLTHQSGSYTYVRSQHPINSGKWEYWTAVKEGSGAKLYKNGAEDLPYTGGSPTAINNPVTSVRNFTIGTGNTWGKTLGSIDEVRIYDTALTVSQVQSQYYAGLNNLLVKGLMSEEEYRERLKLD